MKNLFYPNLIENLRFTYWYIFKAIFQIENKLKTRGQFLLLPEWLLSLRSLTKCQGNILFNLVDFRLFLLVSFGVAECKRAQSFVLFCFFFAALCD